jgi:hypothetical protein
MLDYKYLWNFKCPYVNLLNKSFGYFLYTSSREESQTDGSKTGYTEYMRERINAWVSGRVNERLGECE